jgi:hypothetical protein
MNHTTPDMIEIKSLSTSMIEDGTDALVTCLVKKEGMVRLKMNRTVLEGFCKEAIQELARKRMPDSGDSRPLQTTIDRDDGLTPLVAVAVSTAVP